MLSESERTGVWPDCENKTIAFPDAKGRMCTLYVVGSLHVVIPLDATPGEAIAAAVTAERARCLSILEAVENEGYDDVAWEAANRIRSGSNPDVK